MRIWRGQGPKLSSHREHYQAVYQLFFSAMRKVQPQAWNPGRGFLQKLCTAWREKRSIKLKNKLHAAIPARKPVHCNGSCSRWQDGTRLSTRTVRNHYLVTGLKQRINWYSLMLCNFHVCVQGVFKTVFAQGMLHIRSRHIAYSLRTCRSIHTGHTRLNLWYYVWELTCITSICECNVEQFRVSSEYHSNLSFQIARKVKFTVHYSKIIPALWNPCYSTSLGFKDWSAKELQAKLIFDVCGCKV